MSENETSSDKKQRESCESKCNAGSSESDGMELVFRRTETKHGETTTIEFFAKKENYPPHNSGLGPLLFVAGFLLLSYGFVLFREHDIATRTVLTVQTSVEDRCSPEGNPPQQ